MSTAAHQVPVEIRGKICDRLLLSRLGYLGDTIQHLSRYGGHFVATLGIVARLRNSVRFRLAGADPNSNSARHAVYVHFDSAGEIADFVVRQLQEFAALGFRITFVSNSPNLNLSRASNVAALCREIIHRNNVGYDFAAYRDGILSIRDFDRASCLILANDSVYGPLFPLKELLDRCDPTTFDVWGATDSEEIAYHVQSYFVLFHAKALRSRAFRRFWTWFPNVSNRKWVIRYGEIGLSQRLMRGSLRIGAVFSCVDAEMRRDRKIAAVQTIPQSPQTEHFFRFVDPTDRLASTLNPTQVFWEEMVTHERFPFLKRDLIRDNIQNIPAVTPWQSIIDGYTSYDRSLIERHLSRDLRKPSSEA